MSPVGKFPRYRHFLAQPLRFMPPCCAVASNWVNLEHLLPLGVLAIVLTATPIMVFCPAGLPRVRHLEAERNRIETQISTLTREIAQLRAEVKKIRSDPTAVEQVARDELGLVRPTEVVFLFGP